jgi:hypothetical protein
MPSEKQDHCLNWLEIYFLSFLIYLIKLRFRKDADLHDLWPFARRDPVQIESYFLQTVSKQGHR